MKTVLRSIAINLFLVVCFCCSCLQAQEIYNTQPLKNEGMKWRIGFVEGGPYANYQSILEAMIKSLIELGWIEDGIIPKSKDESETKTLWNYLSSKIKSEYLEFPSDAYYSCDWHDSERKKLQPIIIDRLNNKADINLVLAFGTWAGQDLANNQHSTPTIVLSASNAVRSGIIKSVEDSGFDHIHAWIDPKKPERQLRLFHEIFGFKKIGLAYDNDIDGRSYAAVEDVHNLAQELGFQVVECHTDIHSAGISQEERELTKCYNELAPKIDAMYITDYAGLTQKNLPNLLSPLFAYQLPMFAQTRYDLVENGILMGAGRTDFKADAKFYVQTLTTILNGSRPRDLPQIFESPLKLVVNLESAKKIGFRVPIDILAGAFEVHEKIIGPTQAK